MGQYGFKRCTHIVGIQYVCKIGNMSQKIFCVFYIQKIFIGCANIDVVIACNRMSSQHLTCIQKYHAMFCHRFSNTYFVNLLVCKRLTDVLWAYIVCVL